MKPRSDRRSPARSLLQPLTAALALAAILPAQGFEVGFPELYALAKDRAEAVATLIPGTEDWYYYRCRERLDARDFATVRQVLEAWIARYHRNAQVMEIEDRLALLSFAEDPEATFRHLRQRLSPSFGHQRQLPGAQSDLPARLDPALLSPARLNKAALQRHPGTADGFEDRALAALLGTQLSPDQLHSVLGRLRRPDVANLPALVVADLRHKQSRGFGSLPIHGELRRAQLDECAALLPELLDDPRFVQACLVRLAPRSDVPWQSDAVARQAQLGELWQFAQRLAPAHNSLKAHVLCHWLRHDLGQGKVDRERFLAYIRLPRNGGPIARNYHERFAGRGDQFVDPSRSYPTGLPEIGDDSGLLRACLEQLFASEENVAPYAQYLDQKWLEGVLAETRLLLGQGDLERWHTLLDDPRRVEALEKRVEISFPPTQPVLYGAGDPVRLAVDTKNVPTLLLKVFVVDSYRYHVERQQEVNATIELDGLVANHEQTFAYDEVPLRRVRRTFDLPLLQAPGTYVVELVGNGISSRAVIHKGTLRAVERTAAAGHLFRVFDERGALQKDAVIWFGGREYGADADGDVLIPFASDPGQKLAVLRVGDRSAITRFLHRAESFALLGQAFVEREALVAGQTARLCVRPELRVDGHRVALKLLQDPVLAITAVDIDGIARTDEVRGLALVDGREFVHEIGVPGRLQSLRTVLRGKVKDLGGNDVELATAATTFAVSRIDTTAETVAALLVPTAAGYEVELRGKNGEVIPGRPCAIAMKHRDYRQPIDVTLQTDAEGRIALGALADVDSLGVQIQGGGSAHFALGGATANLPALLQGRAGAALRLPYQGRATGVTRQEFALLAADADAFAHLALADGFLELRGLPAGDYELHLHERGAVVQVRITDGQASGEWIVGRSRALQAAGGEPLHLRALRLVDGELQIGLTNFTPHTRVHVVTTRYAPAFDPFAHLSLGTGTSPAGWLLAAAESSYHSGRKLGDEYRYVLERRFAPKFAGNMLQRPGLLSNPWALDRDSKNAAVGLGGGKGDRYGGPSAARPAPARSIELADEQQAESPAGTFANLDFLPAAAATRFNLVPDANGMITVASSELGDGQVVHVVAIDGDEALYDRLLRDERPLLPRARTLPQALPAEQHFVEQKRIEFVATGGTAVLGDGHAAQVEVFDSLAGVYRLMATISGNAELQRFQFLTRWPTLDAAEQRRLYSEHACHELHFFLYRKDRAFFDAVVRPLLADKLHKTFLDHWLLGDDVRAWLEPWAFARLNLIEQILLAQRLSGDEQAAIARHVAERLELRPVDRERLEALFETALTTYELADKDTGIAEKLRQAGEPGGNYRGPADAAPPPPRGGAATGRPAADGPTTAGPGAPAARPEARRLARSKAKNEAADEKAGAPQTGSDDFLLGAGKRREAEGKKQLDDEAGQRGAVAKLFAAVKPTKLLVESNYWRLTMAQTGPDLVAPNRFWCDYAAAPAGAPFASAAFVEASGSFLEIVFALAVLDLPFTAGAHEIVVDGERRILRAATPLLLVRKEISPAAPAADGPPLLLGEHFFRLDDRYHIEDGEQREKLVSGEFLCGVAYGAQVVVSNPTGQRRAIDVLLQVPAGALPVQRGTWTRSAPLLLGPYETKALEYAFYFPAAGDFAHYPAQAASKGDFVAAAKGEVLHVVATPSQLDTRSWEHVSQQGSAAEVLAFLDGHNVERLDLTRIAWRMQDRGFFLAATDLLRARHVYDATLWAYGLLHRHVDTTREYLRHADAFLASCGAALRSELVTFDPIERGAFEQIEFEPLVHARAHRLGGKHVIGNADLARQYAQLLSLLGYRERLDSQDWLVVTYYLLLQDRIEDALAAAANIAPQELATRIQYDYLSAYLCFFTGEASKARALAAPYRDHPVLHWQRRFRDVLTQLDEVAGKAGPGTGEPAADVASKAPALDFVLTGTTARIGYANLDRCELRYYELDVEFAFSAQPFASSDGSAAAWVQPTLREERALPAGATALEFVLPARFHNRNVLVEVRAGGLVRARTHFANALDVRFLESYGQVVVSDPRQHRPLPKTYVKVFARLPNGQVRFHKDGYTDLRGRFDYASLSDDPNAEAQRYAVLVLSDELGAVIRDVPPPMQ